MGQVIPRQHPAVVLKSHYKTVRSLLAVALVAIVALAATVVILANDDDQVSGNTSSAQPVESINYGGFNPATGKPVQQETLPPGTRFDGGPDEGTRGMQAAPAPGTRLDRPRRGHARSVPPRRSSRWARAAASRTRFRQRRQRAFVAGGPVSRGWRRSANAKAHPNKWGALCVSGGCEPLLLAEDAEAPNGALGVNLAGDLGLVLRDHVCRSPEGAPGGSRRRVEGGGAQADHVA